MSLLQQLLADVFRRADVEAAGGLRSDDHARVAGDLTRQDHLLDIAAGEIPGQRVARGCLDLEFFDQFIGMPGNVAQVQKAGAGKRLFLMFAQDHVFRDSEILDHAVPHAFFGDVGKHAVGQVAGGKARDILPFQIATRRL